MNNRNTQMIVDAAAQCSVMAFGGARTREVRWAFEARDRCGRLKWREEHTNLVVATGLDLDNNVLFGGTAKPSFYVGLISGTPTVAGTDTMSSHAGWTEISAYDEAARQAFTAGSSSSGSISNTASKASFTISTNGTTIGGAFLSTDSTKGGTSGTLYSAGAFTAADKSLDDGDTLDVTVTITAAAS